MPIVLYGLMKEVEEVCTLAVKEFKKNPKLARLKIFHGRKPKNIIFALQALGRCARRHYGKTLKNIPLREASNEEFLSDLWTFADTSLLIASIYSHTALGHLDAYHLGISDKKIVPSSVTRASKSFAQSLRCIELTKKLLGKRSEIYRLHPKQKK